MRVAFAFDPERAAILLVAGNKAGVSQKRFYNQLIAKPTRSVGKAMAQMELADAYASTQQPGEAKRVYEQIQKENPASEVAQLATQKLQQLK